MMIWQDNWLLRSATEKKSCYASRDAGFMLSQLKGSPTMIEILATASKRKWRALSSAFKSFQGPVIVHCLPLSLPVVSDPINQCDKLSSVDQMAANADQPAKRRRFLQPLLQASSAQQLGGPTAAAAASADEAGTVLASSGSTHAASQPLSQDPFVDGDADGALEAPSDVEAALLLLKAEVHSSLQQAAQCRTHGQQRSQDNLDPLPPFLLKGQIYTVLSDRTAVDRELDDLVRRRRTRTFKLATAADEYAVLLMGDYLAVISRIIGRLQWQAQQQQQPPLGSNTKEPSSAGLATTPGAAMAAVAALEAFRDRVVPRCQGARITTTRLLQLMAMPSSNAATHTHTSSSSPPQAAAYTPPLSSAGAGSSSTKTVGGTIAGATSDACVSHLLAAELLSRDPLVPGQLTFTIPGAGRIVRCLVDGRQELQQILSKKRCGRRRAQRCSADVCH